MGVMEANSTRADRMPEGKAIRAVSLAAEDELEGWGTIILSIPVGLLALGFFLAMGGIFAVVGPSMILAAIHLVRQKRVRKVGGYLRKQARELVAAMRIHATWQILYRDERASFTQSVSYKPEITTSNSTGTLWSSVR